MPIRELEPRFRVGRFNIGKKPGRVLGLNEEVIVYSFSDRHGDSYVTFARIVRPDQVQLVLRSSCGDEPSTCFEGPTINTSFYLRGYLRWVSH